jgi:uncharacterized protein
MATTHLKVISPSDLAAVDPLTNTATLWQWSPDAKLLPGSKGQYSVCNFANGSLSTIDNEQGRLLSRVSGISIPFRLPAGIDPELVDRLHRQGILLSTEQAADYEETIRARIARSLQNSYGLIVMPTEKCNYRCTYCYESFENGRMTEAAADSVALAIERIAGSVEYFSLGFFGGEPLMCADLVLRFSECAFRARAAKGLSYAAGITTNAHYLTPELFEQLLDVGVISYQITIDGDRGLHDTQRVTIAGAPTFDRIVGHLRAMAANPSKFSCTVRCNARPEDRDRVMALFEGEELRPLKDDPRFVVAMHQIWASDRKDVGGAPPPAEDQGCSSQAAMPLDRFLYDRELERRGFRTNTFRRDTWGLASSCYAGKPNWFVVGPDLTLYKCTVVFDRDENRVGRVNADGTFTVDEAKQQLWTGSNALTDTSCGTCHLRVPCSGLACPLTRFSEGHKSCPEAKSVNRLRAWSQVRTAP